METDELVLLVIFLIFVFIFAVAILATLDNKKTLHSVVQGDSITSFHENNVAGRSIAKGLLTKVL